LGPPKSWDHGPIWAFTNATVLGDGPIAHIAHPLSLSSHPRLQSTLFCYAPHKNNTNLKPIHEYDRKPPALWVVGPAPSKGPCDASIAVYFVQPGDKCKRSKFRVSYIFHLIYPIYFVYFLHFFILIFRFFSYCPCLLQRSSTRNVPVRDKIVTNNKSLFYFYH